MGLAYAAENVKQNPQTHRILDSNKAEAKDKHLKLSSDFHMHTMHMCLCLHTHTPQIQKFFSFETCSHIAECGGLDEVCPTSLRHLNIWFQVVVVWGRLKRYGFAGPSISLWLGFEVLKGSHQTNRCRLSVVALAACCHALLCHQRLQPSDCKLNLTLISCLSKDVLS